jgi:predicted RNA-binding Zn-ribbon protein involved in translation (DUF1610 family)
MPGRPGRHKISSCPQCGFRFRGRSEDYEQASPLSRKLFWAGFLILLPVMLGVAAFIALTRDERGLMMEFTGRANLIMLAITMPSMLLFVAAKLVPKLTIYRCPQCRWQKTMRGDTSDLDPTNLSE